MRCVPNCFVLNSYYFECLGARSMFGLRRMQLSMDRSGTRPLFSVFWLFLFPKTPDLNDQTNNELLITHRKTRAEAGTRRVTRQRSFSGVFDEEKGTCSAVTQGRSLDGSKFLGYLYRLAEDVGENIGLWTDHLREERLAVHIHGRQVDPRYIQYGESQVNVQHWSLKETRGQEC